MRFSTALAFVLLLLSFVLVVPATAQDACAIREGSLALEAGNYTEAITVFDCVLTTDPTNAVAYLERAQAHMLSGTWLDGMSDFISADRLWTLNHSAGQINLDWAERHINEQPENTTGYILRAYQRWYWGQDQDALSDQERILELEPDNLFALTFGGSSGLLINTDDWEEWFDRALELAPGNPQVLTVIGMSYMYVGYSDQAFRYLSLAPDFAPALYYRGQVNNDLQRYPSAIEDFERALELGLHGGMRANALISLASAYLHLQRSDEALDAVTQANALFPEGADVAQRIAITYDDVGDSQQAAYWYNQFILRAETYGIDADALTIGEPRRITISYGTITRFPIPLTTGQTVTFLAESQPTHDERIDPLIVLLAPDGTPLLGNDDTALFSNLDSQIAEFVVPADATYTLAVTSTDYGVQGHVVVTVTIVG